MVLNILLECELSTEKNTSINVSLVITQPVFIFSKSTIETPGQCMKSSQSYPKDTRTTLNDVLVSLMLT